MSDATPATFPAYVFHYADGVLADKVGSGFRYLLVLSVGRIWAEVFYVPTLTKARVLKETLAGTPTDEDFRPAKVLTRLREVVAQRKRLNMAYPETAVKEALALLRSLKISATD